MSEGLGVLLGGAAFALLLGWIVYEDGYSQGYEDAQERYESRTERVNSAMQKVGVCEYAELVKTHYACPAQ